MRVLAIALITLALGCTSPTAPISRVVTCPKGDNVGNGPCRGLAQAIEDGFVCQFESESLATTIWRCEK